jgi:hypothetical protein
MHGFNGRAKVVCDMTAIYGSSAGKTSFTTDKCIDVYLSQSQDWGSNAKASCYFNSDVMYSYGAHYIMARIMPVNYGHDAVVLINSNKSSATTESHKSIVTNKARCGFGTVFYVPHMVGDNMHELNVLYYRTKFAGLISDTHRKGIRKATRVAGYKAAALMADMHNLYCDTFNLSRDDIGLSIANYNRLNRLEYEQKAA